MVHIDGFVRERGNSIANALELRLSCTNPSIWSMVTGLVSPTHYLNQYWLIISEVLWHSPEGSFTWSARYVFMMTSSNGNILRATGHLCGEFTGGRWIPRTKASDAELWCFSLICASINGWVNNREAGELKRHRAHYDFIVMYARYEFLN